MLKLTKTGIGLLTKQYRSVLRKCLLLNLGIFTSITLITQSARGSISISSGASLGSGGVYNYSDGIGIGEYNTVVYSNLGIALGNYAIAGLSTNPSDTLSAYNAMGVEGINLARLTAGNYDVALGSYSGASGLYSSAVGHRAYAIGNETAVLGNHAIARADYSVVLGSSSSTSEDYVISVGHKSTDLGWNGSSYGEDLFRRIVNVAAGQNDNDVVILKQLNDALNYYYTKTEADARYALLDTIGDVDYSDEAEDEGSALKNGAEDSPTTVRGALDLLDTKIGSLNETGIAGDDVATQLKYILENGSTGGTGVSLSTLGYIGANTPYLNTTNEAMNFSSTYTIGGNMSTLANQIKTNETNISNLSSRVNQLGSYSNGSADISENYAKIIGNTSIVTNSAELSQGGNIIQPYATLQDVNLKSYTVEITTPVVSTAERRLYRIQVNAPSEEEAIVKAKNKIINSGWSNSTLQAYGDNVDRYYNKYMYGRLNSNDEQLDPIGIVDNVLDSMNDAIQATNDVKVTKNNYKVAITIGDGGGIWSSSTYTVYVNAENKAQAREKAEDLIMEGFYIDDDGIFDNIYDNFQNGHWYTILDSTKTAVQTGLDTATSETKTKVAEGSLGTINTYALGSHTIIENIALLDNAIGDLGTTGVSGASVAAQLKLLGEVGSEALGQKIGSWTATKDSISQTLGEETKKYGYLTAFEYDSENEQYIGTVGDNLQALDSALSLTAKGLDALSHQLYNYYYTKTEADARYALLEAAIGDVDDKVEDVDDKVDAVEAKIGDLNETGIAGNDVATQLKYILENGSTGGAGVSLSTLGYIGANTPYLNTTSNAMNFSSTYTIGGNLSTLANQIKTNETNISNLSSRVNLLGSYSNGGADISENYAKVIGNTSIVTNIDNLKNDGNIVKAYATPATLNNKSYTVELHTKYNSEYQEGEDRFQARFYRVQVAAPSQEEAVKLAKDEITRGWIYPNSGGAFNKYAYAIKYEKSDDLEIRPDINDYTENIVLTLKQQVLDADATATENNYTVLYRNDRYNMDYGVDVNASSSEEAVEKADAILRESFYINKVGYYDNLYRGIGSIAGDLGYWMQELVSSSGDTTATSSTITEGSRGASDSYVLGAHTIIENIALLDSAIGDLSATGVSGNSVAAQLKLLGEVGSEALGQKIGSWSTTKNSISQTLGEETKNYGYLTAFDYDSENEQYVGTVGDNLQALDSALSLTAKGLDALSHQLLNYYYTFRVDERIEAAEFALFLDNEKLSSVFEV